MAALLRRLSQDLVDGRCSSLSRLLDLNCQHPTGVFYLTARVEMIQNLIRDLKFLGMRKQERMFDFFLFFSFSQDLELTMTFSLAL